MFELIRIDNEKISMNSAEESNQNNDLFGKYNDEEIEYID